MTYHKNSCSVGHEIKNFGRPFLAHHFYILHLSDSYPRVKKVNIFTEMHQFCNFYPKPISPWGGGHKIYNFLSRYTTDATYQIWLRLAK